jgi:hypothetical protein
MYEVQNKPKKSDKCDKSAIYLAPQSQNKLL